MFGFGKDCCFCGHSVHGNRDCRERHHGGDDHQGEWKRCHEEEKCFDRNFECREKRTVECREKERCRKD